MTNKLEEQTKALAEQLKKIDAAKGPLNTRKDSDLQTIVAAVKSSMANDCRKAGIY